MSEPWEDYQRAPAPADVGPWSDYARPAVATPMAAGPVPGDEIDVSSLGDWRSAKAAIDKLPENVRPRVRDRYAESVIAKEREGGGAVQTAGDYVQRVGRSIPGIGPWIGEASAGLQAMFGGDYEMASAYERALERAVKQTKTPTVATLPLIGDVTAGGLAETAGLVGGSLAMPMLRVAAGTGAGATAANVGVNAALYGGADAAGNAEPGSRIEEGLKGAAIGGAVGAPLGAVIGRIANRAAPTATDAVAADAARAGVDLPRVAAGGDGIMGTTTRQIAGGTAQIPGIGAPLVRASGRAIDQMENSATRVAEGYSPAPVAGVPAGSTPATAGEAARDAMSEWIRDGSARTMNRLYQEVERRIPPSATGDLSATRFAMQTLLAEDAAAASNVYEPVYNLVADAVSRPGGLTYRGMQQLRTNVGAMMDDHLLPAAGTSRPALKRVYSALTRDLETLAQNSGGQDAVRAWQRANSLAADVSERRETLTRIIGADGSKSPESIVEKLIDMAGTGRSADIYRLTAARRSIKDAWDEVASAAVHRLGRNQSDEFSPAVFMRKYSALSDRGRQLLFNSTGRADLAMQLDSLAAVAQRFDALNRFANPSGTGRATAVLGGLTGVATGAVSIPGMIAAAAPGFMAARIMASPIRVRQISQASQRVYEAITSPNGERLFQPAILGLARAIAEETKEDPAVVAARITRSLGAR